MGMAAVGKYSDSHFSYKYFLEVFSLLLRGSGEIEPILPTAVTSVMHQFFLSCSTHSLFSATCGHLPNKLHVIKSWSQALLSEEPKRRQSGPVLASGIAKACMIRQLWGGRSPRNCAQGIPRKSTVLSNTCISTDNVDRACPTRKTLLDFAFHVCHFSSALMLSTWF